MLGTHRSPDVIKADIQRLLSIVVWNALVINSLPVFSREQIVNLASIEGMSCLDDVLDGSRPVLIWSYHFGVHPVIVAAILHARGYPIHAITHVRRMPVTASAFQRRYLHRLRRVGDQFPVIDPREGPQRAMLDVLRHKECLYVTPDYMLPEDELHPNSAFEVPIDFLGRKARLQTGGLRLAKRFKARVVTVLSMPGNGNKRCLSVEPFDLPTSGLTPTELQQDLQACMRRLETRVLAHPHLWLDLKRDDLPKRLSPT
jgi:lauroyl/myristoyl acyltransferase